MHVIEAPEVDIVDNTSNQLTSTGKLLVGTTLFVVLILTVFLFDFFSMSSHADLPTDAMGVCQVEYSDTALLPVTENGSGEDTQNAEPVVKHTYIVTMPDGQKLTGYGVNGTYIPLDGEYAFSGVLREDGAYNITVDSSYIPISIDDVHEASKDTYDTERAFVTQVISDFTWLPEDEKYVDENADDEKPGEDSSDVADVTAPTDNENAAIIENGEDPIVPENEEEQYISSELNEDEFSMSIDEKLAVSLPSVSSNPMEIVGHVEDGTNHTQEGLACEDASVNVIVDYKNLFASDTFTLEASIINVRDGEAIKNADGTDLIAARDFTSAENTAEFDGSIVSDAAKIDGYADAFSAVLNMASADETANIALPTIENIESVLAEAKEMGGKIISEKKDMFEPVYTYAAQADLAMGRNLPSLQNVADTCERIYADQLRHRLADGTFEMNIPVSAESVKGKTIAVKVNVIYQDNVVATLPSDIKDTDYYVSYPSIETEATIRGVHEAKAEPGTVIIDTVEYENLVPGVQYHLESTVLDEDTQSIVLDSQTAEKVKFITEFVPEKSSGIINVIFPDFDSSSMMGRKAVITEKIFRCETNVNETNADQGEEAATQNENTNTSGILHSSQKGTLVAAHEDLDDPMSSIDFNQDISLAETGGEMGTISAMGETPRPYIFVGIIITALVAIAAVRLRQRI